MSGSGIPVEHDRVVKTVCKMCYLGCGVNVYVKDGRIVYVDGMVEHPMNQGQTCVKVERAAMDFVYAEDRLKYPMKKEGGQWRRITWDEALDTISDRLKKNKEKYGPGSLLTFAGDATTLPFPFGAGIGGRFCDVYGTPNRATVGSICYIIHGKASMCTLGKFVTPDLEKAKCVILWGHNPHDSMPANVTLLEKAIADGAKLIVVDPRKTEFAKKADIHIQPRPGTDAALALGMLNVIISEGLYDKEFVEKWTYGFDKLAERAKQYPLDKVAKITWVPAKTIADAARMFATKRPGCVVQGTNTLDQQASGFQNARLSLILPIITGSVDVPGGIMRVSGSLRLNTMRLPEKINSLKLMGADQYPLSYSVGETTFGDEQAMEWPDVILSGDSPIKMGLVNGSNPVVIWPNTNKVRQALEKLDFLVVMDIFMTATAELADIVLPACTFFETTGICYSSGRLANAPWTQLRNKVIEPLWESWPDWKFWFGLAKRMGYHEYFPWKDGEEYLRYLLEPMQASGVTLEKLRENPGGIAFGKKEYHEYEERGFKTPSGKIELYSQMLEKLGCDPLPYYEENPETPLSAPEIAKEYPLILTSGARRREYWHSQFRNISSLREIMPEALAEIHPDTAKKYGISYGDRIVVETKRGSIEIKAKITEDILPGIILIPHGWAKGNVNILTDNKPADRITGYPAIKGGLCRIRRS